MSVYQKNLRRLGIILIVIALVDLILELTLFQYLASSKIIFISHMQSLPGICIKDGIGLLIGVTACFLYYHNHHSRWVVWALTALLAVELASILVTTNGSMVKRIDNLINATLILTAMVVYTSLQLERSERDWQKIRDSKPSMLDLKLSDVRQWFNPIEIGPKLELSADISAVVNRFLETSREQHPLAITIRCPNEVSDSMQSTMQEVFQMYYEDEERRINSYLERRYIRVMALVIISITAITVWINFSPSTDEGVTWTILSNFAAFSLWQIGSTYFERSDGYGELLRSRIAKQAKLYFWAS